MSNTNTAEYGCLRQDDDCHWYLVPEQLLDQFDDLVERVHYEDLCDKFCELFDEFRLGGSPQRLLISMDQLKE